MYAYTREHTLVNRREDRAPAGPVRVGDQGDAGLRTMLL